jgi:hypothetical protein
MYIKPNLTTKDPTDFFQSQQYNKSEQVGITKKERKKERKRVLKKKTKTKREISRRYLGKL